MIVKESSYAKGYCRYPGSRCKTGHLCVLCPYASRGTSYLSAGVDDMPDTACYANSVVTITSASWTFHRPRVDSRFSDLSWMGFLVFFRIRNRVCAPYILSNGNTEISFFLCVSCSHVQCLFILNVAIDRITQGGLQFRSQAGVWYTDWGL